MIIKNRKGFTMIELLGVIIILGLLLAIAIPAINRQLAQFRLNYYEDLETSVESSGKDYMTDKRYAKPTKLLYSKIVKVSDLEDEGYIDEIEDYVGNKCDNTDTSYSYVVVVKTGDKTYDYTACLKCSADDYATDTSGKENDYCNEAWLTNDNIVYDYNYNSDTLYVYYGTDEEEIKEQVGLTYNTIKQDSSGNTLASIAGDDEAVYPQNINELVGKNVNTIVTLKYTLPDGTQLTKDALIYKHNAPKVTMEYTNGNSATGKSAGDTYTSGEWSNGVQVTIAFSDSDIEEIFTNGGIKIGKVEYYDSSTSSWKDTGCTVSASGKTCVWTISSNFNKTVKFRITNNNGFVSDESSEVTIKVDVTDPSCELTTTGTLGSNNWYTSNVTIALTKNDKGGSDIASYGIGTSTTASYNSKSSVNYTSNTSGITYYGYVRDGAGNTNTCNATFKKDSSTPSVPTVTFYKWSDNGGTIPTKGSTTNKGSTISISTEETTWSNKKVYSEPSGGDNTTSGVDHYEYTTDGATTQENNTTGSYRNIKAQGESTIKYRACNEAGTCSAYTSAYMVGVDYTAPECTIVDENTLKSTSIKIGLKCSDTYSGISAYYWGKTSGLTPSTTTASDITSLTSSSGLTTTVSSSKPGTYYLYGKDAAGNVSSGTNQTYYSYNVHNMLQKTSGTAGKYNTINYEEESNGTYIARKGTTLTYSSVYTKPITYSTYEGYSTSNSTSSLTDGSASLTSNGASLYYWFDRNTYTITYNLNNGSNSSSNPSSYTYGVGVNSFADPTRTGYTFDGWYTASSGGTKVTSISTTATGNKTLYARWKTATYTIEFVDTTIVPGFSTSTYYSSCNGTKKTATYNSTWSLCDAANKLTSAGKSINPAPVFNGWYTGTNGTGTKITSLTPATDNLVVYAYWTQDTKGYRIHSRNTATTNLTHVDGGVYYDSSKLYLFYVSYCYDASENSFTVGSKEYSSGKWCMVYPNKNSYEQNGDTLKNYSTSSLSRVGLLPAIEDNNFVFASKSFFGDGVTPYNNFYIKITYKCNGSTITDYAYFSDGSDTESETEAAVYNVKRKTVGGKSCDKYTIGNTYSDSNYITTGNIQIWDLIGKDNYYSLGIPNINNPSSYYANSVAKNSDGSTNTDSFSGFSVTLTGNN